MSEPDDPFAAHRPQWDLTVEQASAHRGQGQRGGAFLMTREVVLAVAGELERLRKKAGEEAE